MKNAWTKHNAEGTRSGQSAALRPKREAPPPPPAPVIRDENTPRPGSTEAMRARLASMSLPELNAFRDNAARISADEGNKKQEQASEMLPEIYAEIESRKATKVIVEADKRKVSMEKRAATRALKKRHADAEAEAAADAESSAE